MIFIIGGAAQGKRQYASGRTGIPAADMTDGAVCTPEEALHAPCILHYEQLVRRLEDPEGFTQQLIRDNPAAVIVQQEIGCGIVPMDREERTWREHAGRCGCLLAAGADEVVRLFCGIPTHIKGECT